MKDLAVTVTNSLGILGDCSYCAYVASIDGNPHATPPEKLHAQKVEKEHGIVIERAAICACRNLCVCQGVQWSWVECRNFYSKWQPHLIYIYIYICHSHVLHFITAHTSGHAQLRARCAMRWRGCGAEHLCWRCSAVRWPWGRTGPFRRAPQRPRQVQASQVRPCTCTCGQGALNSDPLVRLACRFVQCTSREWTASALSRLGRRLAHSRGKKAPASSDS